VVLAVNFKHLSPGGAGGAAEPREDQRKAAIREFEKETGFSIPHHLRDEVKYFGSTVTTHFRGLGPRVCHAWALLVDDEVYEQVIRSRPQAVARTEVRVHFGSLSSCFYYMSQRWFIAVFCFFW
jgi:8-oxo-dGTP pyrophosphatase MutT (NUDIX family)